MVSRTTSYVSTFPVCQKLQQYANFIATELKQINKNEEKSDIPQAPDLERLKVYSRAFDLVIDDLKTYAPILSEIKVP